MVHGSVTGNSVETTRRQNSVPEQATYTGCINVQTNNTEFMAHLCRYTICRLNIPDSLQIIK